MKKQKYIAVAKILTYAVYCEVSQRDRVPRMFHSVNNIHNGGRALEGINVPQGEPEGNLILIGHF